MLTEEFTQRLSRNLGFIEEPPLLDKLLHLLGQPIGKRDF